MISGNTQLLMERRVFKIALTRNDSHESCANKTHCQESDSSSRVALNRLLPAMCERTFKDTALLVSAHYLPQNVRDKMNRVMCSVATEYSCS